MAKYKCSFFVRLEEDILEDPDIQDLIEEKGFEGLGVYLGFLTIFRKYESNFYMIPFKKIKFLSKKTFDMTEKKLESIVISCVKNHLLEITEIDGEEYFYSPRRKAELFNASELRHKQSVAAEETNIKLGRGKNKTV